MKVVQFSDASHRDIGLLFYSKKHKLWFLRVLHKQRLMYYALIKTGGAKLIPSEY